MENTNKVYQIITDGHLTNRQKISSLAREAEAFLPYPRVSKETMEFRNKKILCDLYEGHGPYRPRYVLPDYSLFMKNGSEFLGLQPPENLFEAIQGLLCLYHYVPSITGYPVYVGNVDWLLEPFIDSVDEDTAYSMIKWYLISVSRMFPDAFCHLNIGPKPTKTAEYILKADMELKEPVPNISYKYDKDIAGKDLTLLAVKGALTTSKPHFHNHKMNTKDHGEGYGIVSCYNSLKIGGGGHTLVRLNLLRLLRDGEYDRKSFLNEAIPKAAKLLVENINARVKFLVEECKFYENSFLVEEGLIDISKFTSMAGVFATAQTVNSIMEKEGKKATYGNDREANNLAYEIIDRLDKELNKHEAIYCECTGNRVSFHAQSGISEDIEETPGTRIAIGQEPELFEHIRTVAPMHKYFKSGISDIFIFDQTAKDNPDAVLNIINGAMDMDIRTFTINSTDSELVRVTGYLIKKTDIEKFKNKQEVRESSAELGAEAVINQNLLDRKNY